MPRQLQKHQAFPEMPRQLGKFEFKLSTAQYMQPVKCVYEYTSDVWCEIIQVHRENKSISLKKSKV